MKKTKLVILQILLVTGFVFCCAATTAFAAAYDCASGIHDYDTVIIDATETENGSITYTCKLCGYSYVDSIPAFGHIWGAWVVDAEPTCVRQGHEYRVCQHNSEHIQEQNIPATDIHSYVGTVIEPTCTEGGSITCTCQFCGDTYSEDTDAALGHDYSIKAQTPATCENDGTIEYICTRCGDSYTEILPALGHDYGEWITDIPAEEGKEGHRYMVCTRDPSHIIEETLPALPQSESQGESKQWESNTLDYLLCSTELLLIFSMVLCIHSQYGIIKWDKAVEDKFRRRNK